MIDIKRTDAETIRYLKEQQRVRDFTNVHHFDPSHDTVVRSFTHWYIIENNFPYDRVADVHHMLVPYRVFGALGAATAEELEEYEKILDTLEHEQFYDSLQLNFTKDRSVCAHYHVHLIVWKRPRSEANSDHSIE